MDIPLDEKEFNERMLRYQRGELVQRAFPDLSPELREFILTGIAPEEWDEMANEEDE